MYSWLNGVPPCRKYFAYARRIETLRQSRPPSSTSAEKPSLSASPCHTAMKASWNSLRAPSGMLVPRRSPKS